MPTDDDPRVVRSIAVTADDVVAALEYDRIGDRRAVLRVMPPFNGRMRARLHVEFGEERTDAIHIDPAELVADDRPAYPRADETAERAPSDERSESDESPETRCVSGLPKRSSFRGHRFTSLGETPPDEYSPERHYEIHVEAVEEWREAVKSAIVDAVEIETAHGPHRIEVKRLG